MHGLAQKTIISDANNNTHIYLYFLFCVGWVVTLIVILNHFTNIPMDPQRKKILRHKHVNEIFHFIPFYFIGPVNAFSEGE